MLRIAPLLILLAATTLAAEGPSARPNVLFIAVDDLNDWVGCLKGHPQAQTPNLDKLAARGVLFANAHCQAPLCNPSRTSVLTGRRPSTTGVYGLAPGLRSVDSLRDAVTLPQAFARGGWRTFCAGKIFHDGALPPPLRAKEFQTWEENGSQKMPPKKFVDTPAKMAAMDWGPFPAQAEGTADWKIATATIAALGEKTDQPFFIACGFRLPHVPCFAPPEWFDRLPADSVTLPAVKKDDRADIPPFAWYLHWKLPEPRLSWLEKAGEWRSLVRSYLATTSFMDSQLGRVLDALDASGKKENTLVVLWSDHGWHLGEKGITGKNTLWERSTHVPLVIAGPKVKPGGRCAQSVELLDLFPTLMELTGLPAPAGLEGHSLTPQLKDPAAPREWPAITTANPGNHTIRTKNWRYIHYADGAEELYDEAADPNEWTNLAKDPARTETLASLRTHLPKSDAPHAPGSASRILQPGPEKGQWLWEGKLIDPAELED